MKKELFITIVEKARKERDCNAMFEAIFSRARQLVAVHFSWKQECDRNEIVSDFCFKWWENGICFSSEYKPEGLYNLMGVSVRNAAIDLWRSERNHLGTIMFSTFDEDDYDNRPSKKFVDEYAESPMDAYIDKESVREFVKDTIDSRQLHVIVKNFRMTKSCFHGSKVSLREIVEHIKDILAFYFSANEVKELISVLKSTPFMDEAKVDNVFYKIYNETKSKKKKEEKLSA